MPVNDGIGLAAAEPSQSNFLHSYHRPMESQRSFGLSDPEPFRRTVKNGRDYCLELQHRVSTGNRSKPTGHLRPRLLDRDER